MILLPISAVALIFIIIAGLIQVFRKVNFRYFKFPLLIIVICVFGMVVSIFRPYENAVITSGNVSEKLEYAYKTDQQDRKQLKSFIPYLSKLEQRDSKRLKLTKDLYNDGLIKKPSDKFYAAFIYHHSDNTKDYKLASILSAEAAESAILKDDYQAQWLKKAAYDRYMVSIGKPEKYNTQNSFSLEVE
ncbi:hypothetical protein LB465_03285 [Salegentibacter sp. LM13S]|uniref:hypothetical protein n=1 Tax=Salegentibacter lacus TaxID=2873599 RepID=UPI001CCBF37B|nr:hypothetical protein [Salegentibacter lacus]MBZ9629791.1 hypothetical protein [Salegentibacter lacus]